MDSKTIDLEKFREAIHTLNECPDSPVARQNFNNWRHHCFTRYPVGEVLKVQTDAYAELKEVAVPTPRYPRRWTQSQHC